jgi:hypothetical protein
MAQGVDVRPVSGVALLQEQSVHLGFVVENVAVGQVFVQLLSFSLSVSSHWCSIFIRLSPTVYEYRNGLRYEIAPLARYTMNV